MRATEELKLVFLGGVGEIGMNCLAIETAEGIVIVDCGVMFPDAGEGGPDLIIPDLRYFRANRKRIAGVVITHGHEDHIGAVPIVFGELDVPIYAPPYAAALIREKALEYVDGPAWDLVTTRPGEQVEIAGLQFEFIRVTHSIPDALALAIRTPHGVIVHTGDFRIDEAPTLGEAFDREAFARLGDEGVLLLMSDSTNVERRGRTRSEKFVADNVEALVKGHPGRVLISLFSSNVERVRLLAGLARKTGRRLGLVGRSLYTYTRAALETGLPPFEPNELVDPYFADELPGQDLMLLIAGSQGEPRSSLTRASAGEHPDVKVRPGDMVIYSSKIIPGNEKGILRVTNALVRAGAAVYHEGNSDVHVSGHAMRDELASMLELIRPRYFVPVHGEYRFLVEHARLAEETTGATAIVADLGAMLSIGKKSVREDGFIEVEPFYVEMPLIGNAEELKLKERKKLLYNGLVNVHCRLGRGKKGMNLLPQVTLYGVPDPDGSLTEKIASTVRLEFVNRSSSVSSQMIVEEIQVLVRRLVRKAQERKPLVHVTIEGK